MVEWYIPMADGVITNSTNSPHISHVKIGNFSCFRVIRLLQPVKVIWLLELHPLRYLYTKIMLFLRSLAPSSLINIFL